MVDLSTIPWRMDRITKEYIEENREKLSDSTSMTPNELGDAITYCQTAWNPYAEELMSRSGHLEAFREAKTDKERSEILKKSCAYHGFLLF